MLPSAFESLSDPCLPDFWVDIYTAAPGAIAMAAVIAIFLVEFASTRYLAAVDRRIAQNAAAPLDPSGTPLDTKVDDSSSREQTPPPSHQEQHFGHHHFSPAPVQGEVDRSTAATQKLGVVVLEAGIIFHSVFIGLTLAVSAGSDFISLFITIIFHRKYPYLLPKIADLTKRNIRGIGSRKSNCDTRFQ